MSRSMVSQQRWLWSVATLLGAASGGCQSDCQSGSSWCDGSVLRYCSDTGNKVTNKQTLRTTDCAENGLSCFESEGRHPYCGIPEVRCEPAGELCAGRRVGSCSEGDAHPTLMMDCETVDHYCVELDDGGALCSPVAERCTAGEAPRCVNSIVQECAKGAWRSGVKCFGPCDSPGAERCENESSPARCIDGLWQSGPACYAPSGCVVDERGKAACREG